MFLVLTCVTFIPFAAQFIKWRLVTWLIYRIMLLAVLIYFMFMTEQYLMDLSDVYGHTLVKSRIIIYFLVVFVIATYFGNISLYAYAFFKESECSQLYQDAF